MRITYCKHCNSYSYSNRIHNYCRQCKNPLTEVPMGFEKFTSLSINERYRLAYKLTNEYESVLKENS